MSEWRNDACPIKRILPRAGTEHQGPTSEQDPSARQAPKSGSRETPGPWEEQRYPKGGGVVRDSPTLGTQTWTQEARAPQEPLRRARPGSSQETCKIVTLASGWGAAEADGEAGGVSTWEEARTGETRRDGVP